MNNTEKLLRALIDALDFEIEEIKNPELEDLLGSSVPSRIANQINIVDYKVTKKNDDEELQYKQTMFGIDLNNLDRESTIKLIDHLSASQGLFVSHGGV